MHIATHREADTSRLAEGEAGYCWVEDEEAARLALSRALGLPEPVLYEDPEEEEDLIAAQPEEDWESILGQVIDLQERMAIGMKMIQQAEEVLSSARGGKRIPYQAFTAWTERKKILWNHWWKLKEECTTIIGENTWLWYKYYTLAESNLDRTGYSEEVVYNGENIDNLEELFTTAEEDVVSSYEATVYGL